MSAENEKGVARCEQQKRRELKKVMRIVVERMIPSEVIKTRMMIGKKKERKDRSGSEEIFLY